VEVLECLYGKKRRCRGVGAFHLLHDRSPPPTAKRQQKKTPQQRRTWGRGKKCELHNRKGKGHPPLPFWRRMTGLGRAPPPLAGEGSGKGKSPKTSPLISEEIDGANLACQAGSLDLTKPLDSFPPHSTRSAPPLTSTAGRRFVRLAYSSVCSHPCDIPHPPAYLNNFFSACTPSPRK
jgi:hypothetical protein